MCLAKTRFAVEPTRPYSGVRGNNSQARFQSTVHRIDCAAIVAAEMNLLSYRYPGLFLMPLVLMAGIGNSAELAARNAAAQSITVPELKIYVDSLADDSFEGREAGSRGGRAAGNYLIQKLNQLGLEPAAENGRYDQPFREGFRNIFASIDGRDHELADQMIVIGAHYDHVGFGSKRTSYGQAGYIHNGADDNASGTAAILEIAEAFTQLSTAPRRSILFALWDGEEQGLLGSQHWMKHPSISLDHVKFMVNVDMIGRLQNQRLEIYGSRTAPGMRKWISLHNEHADLDIHFPWKMNARSDHFPFFQHGIPVIMFHTGLHDDYHRPSDDSHLINVEGLHQVTQLIFRVTHDLAEQSDQWEFRPESRNEHNAHQSLHERPTPVPKARLGVSWNATSDSSRGVVFTAIKAGSAAHQAGLHVGDRLVRLDGHEITDADVFRSAVLSAPENVTLVVERPGQPDRLDFPVRLSGKPVRLGITWREDHGEPGAVTLVRIAPFSPAHHAGLVVGDRIYKISGQSFKDGTDFLRLANSMPGPLYLQVERNGRISTVSLRVD